MCSVCDGFYAKSYVGRHKKCSADSASAAVSYPIKLLTCKNVTDKFKEVVLCHLYNDEVGNMCQPDDVRCSIRIKGNVTRKMRCGRQLWPTWGVWQDCLWNFGISSKQKNCQCQRTRSLEMLQRSNFHQLEAAVETYTQSDENEKSLKAGLKVGLKRFAKVCKGMHLN